MSWGIKRGLSLFISGFTTSYTVDKYNEIRETSKDFSDRDRQTINKILKTGEFQLPPADEQDRDSNSDNNNNIAW